MFTFNGLAYDYARSKFKELGIAFGLLFFTSCGQVYVAGPKPDKSAKISVSSASSNIITYNNSSVSFTVNYDPGSSISLSSSSIQLSSNDGVTCSANVSAPSANTREVTINNCSGQGTLNVSIAGGTGTNAEGAVTAAASLNQSIQVYMDLEDNAAGTSASKDFSLGNNNGTTWSSSKLTLANSGSCDATSTNCANLSSDWTPRWSALQNYWKLDNSYIDEISGDTFFPISTPTFDSDAKIGTSSIFMDGANAEVIANLTNPIWMFGDYTVNAWIKPDPTSALLGGDAYRVFNLAGCTTPSYALQVWLFDNSGANAGEAYNVRCDSGLGCASSSPTGAGFFSQNKYYMITSVKRGTALEFYVNGSRMFTGTDTLSSLISSCSTFGMKLAGLVDDTAIWNEGLLPEEVALIYQRQSAKFSGSYTSRIFNFGFEGIAESLAWKSSLPFNKELPDLGNNENSNNYSSLVGSTGSPNDNDLMSGIMALWHLNERSAVVNDSTVDFYDRSGNAVSLEAQGSTIRSNEYSIFNKGVYLENAIVNTSSILLSQNAALPYTVSFWFKTNSPLSNESILTQSTSGSNKLEIKIINGSFCYEKTVLGAAKCTSSKINDGHWHHFAFTRAVNGALKLYVDGLNELSSVDSFAYDNTSFMFGSLNLIPTYWDEVAVWSRALHANEINQLYRRGANRVKIQMRACSQSDCSDNPYWRGPNDSTNSSAKHSYYSELLNNDYIDTYFATGNVKFESPLLNLLNFFPVNSSNKQYFQYRAILESDETSGAYLPDLQSLQILPQ
ncbi:MAG: hypothetical protein KA116_01465 [Proteobacteria bacterium]|nr:hypothetical protein [Pseudomonadota bacterium]